MTTGKMAIVKTVINMMRPVRASSGVKAAEMAHRTRAPSMPQNIGISRRARLAGEVEELLGRDSKVVSTNAMMNRAKKQRYKPALDALMVPDRIEDFKSIIPSAAIP
ncbi:hypothetical protein NTGM5_60043 [Candidatus Nitrotoga sp. M5]|nr:hypothetical protein NTGM5_60043 [Candidatus Nitrotoga sp. M5]